MSKNWCQTISKRNEFSFEWTIHNFSFQPENEPTMLQSSIFSEGTQDQTGWRMEVCWKSSKDDDDTKPADFPKLCLKIISGDGLKVQGKINISVLNAKGEKTEIQKTRTISKLEMGWSWWFNNFPPIETLLIKKNELLPNDRLTLHCEISFVHSPVSTIMRVQVPECSLVQDFGDLFDSQELTDFTLAVGDKEFHVHKVILASRSSVFRAMFKNDMKEKQDSRVNITDMDSDVVYQMLRFIYKDNVDTEKLAEYCTGLLAAADKYDLPRLKAICEESLCTNLTVHNCVQVLKVADRHGAKQLKSYAINFITGHSKEIEENSDFKMMLVPKSRVVGK